MNTTMSRGLIRLVTGPVVAASIVGGALGMAAVANANTAGSIHPHTTTGTDLQHEPRAQQEQGNTQGGTQGGGSSNTQGGTQGGGSGNTQGGTQGGGSSNTQGGTQGG
jgi:hypothetical protein